MATLNRPSFKDMTRVANLTWISTTESLPEVARNSGLYRMGTWEPGTGDVKEYSEIDGEEYAKVKSEGGPRTKARVQQGYTKTASPVRRGMEIDITWEMRQRNRYSRMINDLTNLAKHCPNRLDLDLTHRFTFFTATAYTDQDGNSIDISMGDGLAFASTAHTLRGSASTYRNRLANNPAFSKGSLEGMEKLVVEQTFNQFGELKTQPFDIIWSGPDPNTVNAIRQELQSSADISAPNNAVVNVYMGKYRHVILPRLATTANGTPDTTKAKYWGISSSVMSSGYCDIEEENTLIAPSPNSNADDFSTDDWRYKSSMSYSICIVSGMWSKFSTGDGVA